MNVSKRNKFARSMAGSTNGGMPGHFGICWDGEDLKVYSKNKAYVVTRLLAKIVDESGRLRVFDENSRDFYCCLRQNSEKPNKNAFLLLTQNGQYVLSSKEDWIEADIYVQAVSMNQRGDAPVAPLSIWAHFLRKGPDIDGMVDSQTKSIVAVSSDFNVVWLLDTLADSVFAPQAASKEVDSNE